MKILKKAIAAAAALTLCLSLGFSALADGDDDGIDVERELAPRDRDRAAASGGVRLAEFVLEAFNARDKALVVAEDALRVFEEVEFGINAYLAK